MDYRYQLRNSRKFLIVNYGITVSDFIFSELIRGRKKPININNFAGLSRKWVGVKLFMCFPFSLGKKGKHINKISWKSQEKGRDNPGTVPGQSRDNPVKILFLCFLVYWFFFPLPENCSYHRIFGLGKRGLLEKGSCSESPFSRDSSALSTFKSFLMNSPDCGKFKGDSEHFLQSTVPG